MVGRAVGTAQRSSTLRNKDAHIAMKASQKFMPFRLQGVLLLALPLSESVESEAEMDGDREESASCDIAGEIVGLGC